jgi:hypothetical protein
VNEPDSLLDSRSVAWRLVWRRRNDQNAGVGRSSHLFNLASFSVGRKRRRRQKDPNDAHTGGPSHDDLAIRH